MEIQLRELSTKEEMLAHIDMMSHLYPTFTIEKYDTRRNLPPTSWHYSGFGTKLSLIFGFAKSSQVQNHLSIKPNAQIRCSGCQRFGCCLPIFLIINRFLALFWQIKNPILAQISAKFHSFFRFNFTIKTFVSLHLENPRF